MLTPSALPGFCALLQTILCTSLISHPSTPNPPTHDAPTQSITSNAHEMPPTPRPSGFVPPHLLKEITASDACSPEDQRAAAETLRHDESRAMTPKSSQDRNDARRRGANSSSDGDAGSGKSDDGMEGQGKAGGENPFKQAAEKVKKNGGN
ncbi:hypothetical protein IMZ48_20000 [Candidatus Bathyarchaeota archaeon]|nr:hypothetical protein [Candidatus Bathyarchaeota archaeon]